MYSSAHRWPSILARNLDLTRSFLPLVPAPWEKSTVPETCACNCPESMPSAEITACKPSSRDSPVVEVGSRLFWRRPVGIPGRQWRLGILLELGFLSDGTS